MAETAVEVGVKAAEKAAAGSRQSRVLWRASRTVLRADPCTVCDLA